MSENITPLPWTAHKGSLIYAQTEDGEPCVAVTRYDKQAFYALPLSADECAANAAYIVEACNAYPALTARVKELEEALAEAVGWNWLDGDVPQEIQDKCCGPLNKEPKA